MRRTSNSSTLKRKANVFTRTRNMGNRYLNGQLRHMKLIFGLCIIAISIHIFLLYDKETSRVLVGSRAVLITHNTLGHYMCTDKRVVDDQHARKTGHVKERVTLARY